MEKTEETITKKVFVSPELTVHGDVEVITLGFKTGNALDQSFPVGTPFSQLTFS